MAAAAECSNSGEQRQCWRTGRRPAGLRAWRVAWRLPELSGRRLVGGFWRAFGTWTWPAAASPHCWRQAQQQRWWCGCGTGSRIGGAQQCSGCCGLACPRHLVLPLFPILPGPPLWPPCAACACGRCAVPATRACALAMHERVGVFLGCSLLVSGSGGSPPLQPVRLPISCRRTHCLRFSSWANAARWDPQHPDTPYFS